MLRSLAPAIAELTPATIPMLDWTALAHVEPTPKRFIVPKLAPAGEVTLFTGAGGVGKSLLAQQLASAVAAGVPTLRLAMEEAPALYVTCEDDAAELHWRQAHICNALVLDMATLAGQLHVASLRGELDNALAAEGPDGEFRLTAAFDRLATTIRHTGATFVALDNVAHLFVGNENDRGEVTRFINALNRLAGETGAAILLIGHPNKAGANYSGSTAWLNAVRSQIVIERDPASDIRTLAVGKANYAPMEDTVRFAWVDGAFVHEGDLPPDRARAMADTAKANGENAAFLRCLAVCTGQRRNVSHKQGSNFAPQIFAGMSEAKGIKAAGFAAAMERLLHLHQIELDCPLWKGDDRHVRHGIRAVEASA